MRFATAVLSYGVAGPVGRLASRSTRVPDSPLTWHYAEGPWFDNNLACLQLKGRSLRMWWVTGKVVDGDHDRHLALRRDRDGDATASGITGRHGAPAG